MMFNHKTVLGLVAAAAFAPSTVAGVGITIDTSVTGEDLVAALIGPGVMVKNIVLTTGGDKPVAIFTDDNTDTVFGFTDGIVLSTGTVNNVLGPPRPDGRQGLNNFQPGDIDINNEFYGGQNISQDATILEFDFKCPRTSTGLSFQYVFGSEEYNEFVDSYESQFNDAFAFFLNGNNIALLPNGEAVAVNSVNCGRLEEDGSGNFNTNRTEDFCQELYVDNTALSSGNAATGAPKADTQFDGFTRPIFTDAKPPAGFNRLKIVIADATDANFDSAVLLRGNSLVCAPPTDTAHGGGAHGDPHFVTWSGQHYDFHGECDLILLQSKHFESGMGGDLGLDVHIRTQMRRDVRTQMRGDMSYISGAVLRIGSDILEVESLGVYYFNGVAGAELPNEFSGFKFLHKKPTAKQHVFEVHLGGKEIIKVKVYKDFVSVLIEQGASKHFGDSVGLMGDFAYGVKLSRDGKTVLNDANAFGQEWQVLDTDPTLFQTTRLPQHPQKCIMPSAKATSTLRRRLEESSMDQLAAAEKACAHWGKGMDDCVFDVLATGDLEMAEAGSY
jgi:hypothetical protein